MGISSTATQSPSPTREELIKSLRGQKIHIPDLEALMRHWPQEISPHIDVAEKVVNEKLNALYPEGKRLQKMRAADIRFFTCTWWPYVKLDRLPTAVHLAIWLHTWDDELDSDEFTDLIHDLPAATVFRNRTVDFMRACLRGEVKDSTESNDIIRNFQPIGDAVYQLCTPAQSEAFLEELIDFVQTTQTEQEFQTFNQLPTVEQYIQRRIGSGAVKVCFALTEFCHGISLSPSIIADKDMRILWDHASIVTCVTNDLVSIRKELDQGQVDTIVPLLYVRHGDLDRAVKEAVNIMVDSIKTMDEATEVLYERYKDSPEFENMKKVVDACKLSCTGNLAWSLRSGRFKVFLPNTANGIDVEL